MSPVSKIRTLPSGGAFPLPDAAATERAGRTLGCALEAALGPGRACAAADPDGAVIVGLAGGLGAGKTALARAALRALGVEGTVRSPTYTLAEPYETRIGPVWHLDLYRIADPGELEYVAVRDLVSESAACLVEWPERGRGGLPEPDCLLSIAPAGGGRRLRIGWSTARGRAIGSRMLAPVGPEAIGEAESET